MCQAARWRACGCTLTAAEGACATSAAALHRPQPQQRSLTMNRFSSGAYVCTALAHVTATPSLKLAATRTPPARGRRQQLCVSLAPAHATGAQLFSLPAGQARASASSTCEAGVAAPRAVWQQPANGGAARIEHVQRAVCSLSGRHRAEQHRARGMHQDGGCRGGRMTGGSAAKLIPCCRAPRLTSMSCARGPFTTIRHTLLKAPLVSGPAGKARRDGESTG